MIFHNVRIKGPFGFLSQQPDGSIQSRVVAGEWETFTVEIPDSAIPVPPAPQPLPTPPAQPMPLTVETARAIIHATADDYPFLLGPYDTDVAAIADCLELLRRCIFRLAKVGFHAARQKNPSGALSGDKLCLQIEGVWRAFDIMTMGSAGHDTVVGWTEVVPPNPQPDYGIPG